MKEIDYNDDSKEGKLRRWVDNLQLESWQLELLITGFSIFLLASGLDEYEAFKTSVKFDKLMPSNDYTVVFTGAGIFILNTIPYAIRFFLISLLLHLLLRGFWIGIVGLSSVSNQIDFDKLKLKGPFRKHLPQRVRTLDDLIFFVDQISSVVFAYTYLLVFSMLSVVLVSSFLFAFLGLSNVIMNVVSNTTVMTLLIFTVFIVALLLVVAAALFFLDSILFSAFKKSRWFSILFYPIYRFYTVISLSFIYRSIYYHLITNFRKKHIIMVSSVLLIVVLISGQLSSWDRYIFYPNPDMDNGFILKSSHYDDERTEGHIYTASIPSKVAKESFLPLFVRYSPEQNAILRFFCPEGEKLSEGISFGEGLKAGVKSQQDTTRTIAELMLETNATDEDVQSTLNCINSTYEIMIDSVSIPVDLIFTKHKNKGEKGFLQMLDVGALERGKHLIQIRKLDYQGTLISRNINEGMFKMTDLVEIVFWKE